MFLLQNAETKVEEAAKESPKAARLTQQSSEDNEVFGELFRQLGNVTWSVLFLCAFFFIGVALLSLVGGGCFFSLSPKNRRNNSFNILLIYLTMGSTVPERCGKVEERVKKQSDQRCEIYVWRKICSWLL